MANKFNHSSEEDTLVDIHGNVIPTFKTSDNINVVYVKDVKHLGVGVYKKNHYKTLCETSTNFDDNFVDYLLESAKTYMLTNRISFPETTIMKSIDNCRTVMGNLKKTVPAKEESFFKERSIDLSFDDDIRISINRSSLDSSTGSKSKPTTRKSNADTQSESSFDGSCSSDGKKKSRQKNDTKNSRIQYNIDREEFDVLVTHLHEGKPNICWVRKLSDHDLLMAINKKVNEEGNYQNVIPRGELIMDKVYLARAKDGWHRCKIMRFKPLRVVLLDHGNVIDVTQVKEVSEELEEHPPLALRITFMENEYTPRLNDEIRIKRFMKNADGTYFVNVLKTLKVASSKSKTNEVNNLATNFTKMNIKTEAAFFKKPQPLSQLTDNEKVKIICEKNGNFYLRSRNCADKLKNIERNIENYVVEATGLDKVKVDQLVLYRKESDGNFYRAVVQKVNHNYINIELLDYVENYTVNKSNLRSINEQLSKEPLTYFNGGKLSGFETKEFDDDCKAQIKEYIATKKVFTVSLGFDDELDLLSGTELLSERLDKIINDKTKLNKIFFKDMKTYKPDLGLKNYQVGFYKNSKELSLVPVDELKSHEKSIKRSDISDDEPYSPAVLGEVCWCLHNEEWYRCAVMRIFGKYEVLMLDFGNTVITVKENLRKPDKSIADAPILAIRCILINIPRLSNIETLLEKNISQGESYLCDIKNKYNGICHVEIPLVYHTIK